MQTVNLIIGLILVFGGMLMEAIAIFGVFKLKDPMSRMHSAGIADTLGVIFIMVGMILFANFNIFSAKFAITVLIMSCTAPVASHMIGRMIYSEMNDMDDDIPEKEDKRA